MTKQITEIHWKIKVGDKYYGDYVALTDVLNPKYTEKATREEIREIIKQTMEVLTDQAIFTIQKVITGKTEANDLQEEANQVPKGK